MILLLNVEADEARVSDASVSEAIATGGVLRLDEEVGTGWLVVTGEEWTFFDFRSPRLGCRIIWRSDEENRSNGAFPGKHFFDPCLGGAWNRIGEYLRAIDPNFTQPGAPADLTVIERGKVERD